MEVRVRSMAADGSVTRTFVTDTVSVRPMAVSGAALDSAEAAARAAIAQGDPSSAIVRASALAAAMAASAANASSPSAGGGGSGNAADDAEVAAAAAAAARRAAGLVDLLSDAAGTMPPSDESLRLVTDALSSIFESAGLLSAGGGGSGGSGASALPATAQDQALSLLASQLVSRGGAGGLDDSVAGPVLGVLSALADMAVSGGSADRLAAVLSCADSLGQAVLDGLSPGGQAVSISSPQLQLSARIDAPGPTSRLLRQGLAAPGSPVEVDPFPPEALSAAPPGAPIRSLLIVTTFDPHQAAMQRGATSAAAAPESQDAAAQSPPSGDASAAAGRRLFQAEQAASSAWSGGASAGVMRLVISDAVSLAPVPVQNLITPVTFTLRRPAGGGDGADRAACSFWCVQHALAALRGMLTVGVTSCALWCSSVEQRADHSFPCPRISRAFSARRDEAAVSYRTEGCFALPDPLPPGLSVAWDFSAVDPLRPGTMASALVFSGDIISKPSPSALLGGNRTGPSTRNSSAARLLPPSPPPPSPPPPSPPPASPAPPAGPLSGVCTVERLDCSRPGRGGRRPVLYFDPSRPLEVPALTCPPGSADTLVAFVGARCPLWDPARDCFFNATAQAFQGAGCVPADVTSCACRCSFPLSTVPCGQPAELLLFLLDLSLVSPTIFLLVCALTVLRPPPRPPAHPPARPRPKKKGISRTSPEPECPRSKWRAPLRCSQSPQATYSTRSVSLPRLSSLSLARRTCWRPSHLWWTREPKG